jgi:hypothetical protein
MQQLPAHGPDGIAATPATRTRRDQLPAAITAASAA